MWRLAYWSLRIGSNTSSLLLLSIFLLYFSVLLFLIRLSNLITRALLYDGIVARADDPLGQTGVVVDVNINATILFPNGELLEGVPTHSIRNIHPYMQDVHVVKDGWLGRIAGCNVDVWIEFDDGTICKVADAKPNKLPLPTDDASSVETNYFPSLVYHYPSLFLLISYIHRCSRCHPKHSKRHPGRTSP